MNKQDTEKTTYYTDEKRIPGFIDPDIQKKPCKDLLCLNSIRDRSLKNARRKTKKSQEK